MSDLDKLEGLLPKLVHFLPNVRLRTSSSLLFKLESGLLNHILKFNASYVQMIVDSIHESISLIVRENEEWKTPSSAEAQTLSSLCACISQVSKQEPGNESSSPNYSRVLEKLFSLQAYGILEGNTKSNLESAIASIGSIRSPAANNSNYSAEISHNESISIASAELVTTEKDKSTFRGAGAILQSGLASHGWQFPKVILTEIDEKYLFDVEVKVKMGHESASDLLWDCITDFPAPTLVAHPGLIHAVLDVVGSANSDGAPSSPKCLNAVGAMKWLENLVVRAIKSYEAQLDGRLCSLGSSTKEEDDDDEGDFDEF